MRLPITIYVGDQDDGEQGPALRRNPIVDNAQGRDRRTRAHAYLKTIRAAAQARGVTASISLQELPGCGHSFAHCASVGGLVERVFRQKPRKGHRNDH